MVGWECPLRVAPVLLTLIGDAEDTDTAAEEGCKDRGRGEVGEESS